MDEIPGGGLLHEERWKRKSALMQMKADKIYMGALTPVVIERLHISTGPLNNFKSIVIPVTVITFVILSVYFILFLAK